MKIHSIYDPEFKPYGQVLEGYDTACLLKALKIPAWIFFPPDSGLM